MKKLKILFLVPPVVEGTHPAERSSGCTRVVYPTPNIYELQVAACVRQIGFDVSYWDCVNHPLSEETLLNRIGKEAFDRCKSLNLFVVLNREVDLSESLIGFYTDKNGLYRKKDDMTIKGYRNSTAEQYAQKNGFDFVPLD